MNQIDPNAQKVIDDAPDKGQFEINTPMKERKTAKDMLADGLMYEPMKTTERDQPQAEAQEYTKNLDVEMFGFWEGTAENIRTGIMGTAARKVQAVMLGDEVTYDTMNQQYVPDDEDIEFLYSEGIPTYAVQAVMDGARDRDSFRNNVALVKDNLKVEQKTQDSGILGMAGGMVGELISDPTSYIPYGGAAAKGGKGAMKLFNNQLARQLAGNMATAGISEAYLRNQITGKEANVDGALVGAAAATVGLYGVGKFIKRSTLNRIESSETARQAGGDNPNVVDNPDGAPRFVDDGEGGRIEITESGRVFEAGAIPPKSASIWGRPQFMKDLASVAAEADSEDIRGAASWFTRPTQGYKDPFSGETPTVDQLNRVLNSRTNTVMADISEALDEITERNILMGGKLTKRGDAMKRIYQHASGHPNAPQLTDLELKASKRLREYLDMMEDLLDDPSRLSGRSSPQILQKSGQGNYVFRNYDMSAVNGLARKHGIEAIQNAIAKSYKAAYEAAANKAHLDEVILKDYPKMDKVTPEILDDYLKRKAYGIANGDAPSNRDFGGDIDVGLMRDPDHLKTRIPMGTHGEATLPDGTVFRVDDILDYDIEAGMQSYSRSMNGKIAMTAGTGMDENQLADHLAGLRRNAHSAKDKAAMDSLDETIKAFGNKNRTGDYGMLDMLGDTLRDTAFMGSNALMGAGQWLELLSSTFARPFVTAMSIKEFSKIFGRTVKEMIRMKPAEIERTMGDIVAGTAIVRRMNLSYDKWQEGMAARMGKTVDQLSATEKAAMGTRFAALKGAEKSPFTWFLNKTTEAIVKASNDAGMEELIAHANGRMKSHLLSPKFLKSNGISEDVIDEITSLLKGVSAKDVDKIDMNDPRWTKVSNVLHAFGDEIIMKRDLVGQDYASAKMKGIAGRMLMQFKSFALASSSYAVKTIKDVYQLQRFDRFMFAVGSLMSGAVAYPALTMMKSMGMSDSKREEFLTEELSDDKLVVGALKRSPLLAFPSLMYDTVGGFFGAPYAGLSKTTYETLGTGPVKAESGANMVNRGVNHVAGMAPSLRVAGNLGAAAMNAGNLAWDAVDPNHVTWSDEAALKRNLARSIGGFVPNDPLVLRPVYRSLMEQFGIDIE